MAETKGAASIDMPHPANSDTCQTASGQQDTTSELQPIVQYIIVRTDLSWGTGAQIAQACHASVAAIAANLDSPSTKSYLNDLTNMHKVILKAQNADDLLKIEKKLVENNIAYHLWIEKPENVATCLAVAPNPKPLVQALFKHLKLLR